MRSFSGIEKSAASTWFAVCVAMLPGCVASAAGQNVTVTNVFQNHYRYGFPIGNQDCPAGYNIPSGQYPSTYHLERGHAIHHLDPQNSANDYWVYWAHFDNGSYGTAEVAVFKSTTECGPYILQTGLSPSFNADGAGYGFRPGGWQSRDENIFRDSDQTYNADGSVASYASAYLITASDDLGTQKSSSGSTCSYANDSMAIFKMTPDYLGIDASTNSTTNGANWAFVCDQREAPVMFRKGSKYFLVTSQAAGWYPSQGGYGVSSNPLTGWTPNPLALGNSSTFGLQTSDGFTIAGTQDNTYVLGFDHLGGDDSKNAATAEKRDTGNILLPLMLDDANGTATLNWYSSWSVDNTTGVLTLPAMTDLALSGTASSTVTPAAASGSTTYVAANAFDGNFFTKWQDALSGSSAFNPAASTTGTLCPVTGAISTTKCNPSLITDLGSVQPIQEIDLSWYMVKGSEPYYTFRIAYSSDNIHWSTLDYTTFAAANNAVTNNISSVPFSNNYTYGFNALPVNFSARYVALMEASVVQQNSTSPFYAPNSYEMSVIASAAPVSPQPVAVTVTPSVGSTSPGSSFNVAVTVSGPMGQPVPTGYVQLSGPGYISETYGLVNGANSFTVPAGALPGGAETLTASYRADPTSAPVYGVGTTSNSASVSVTASDAPASLTVTQSAPSQLTAAWAASVGASSYVVNRSADGGNTYTQIATTMSTSYTDTGLNNDSTVYCYMVAAVNAAGVGPLTAPVCSTATAVFPITNLAVTQTAPGALTISYNAIANTTGYLIKRSLGGVPYATLTTASSTSYTDTGLADGVYACYTVAAVFSTGTATDSAPVCGTIVSGFAPVGVTVRPTGNAQLTVSWNSGSGVATSYLIKRSVDGGPYTVLVSSQAAMSYTDAGLNNYTSVYCYVVDAVLNGEASADSLAVCNSPMQFVAVGNPSFESPVTSSYIYNPSNASWTFTAQGTAVGSGVTTNSSGFTSGGSVAPDGKQVAFLQGKGSATQTLSGFTAGQTYRLTVAAEERQNKSGGQLGDPVNIAINGSVVASFTAPQSPAAYSDYIATFTAGAASETLTLAGTNALATSTYPDNTVFVDNVRISPIGTVTAPITVQPAMDTLGAASTTLTASESFAGSVPPQGALVFQVNGADQVAGTCSVSGSTVTCSATYATASLAAGNYTISVVYAGDPTYVANSATGTLTITQGTPTVTAKGATCVYGGTPCAGSGAATGVNGAMLSPVTLSYSGTGGTSYGPTATPPVMVGTYSVIASFAGNANYFAGSSAPAAITITPASTAVTNVTVTPSNPQYSDLVSVSATPVSAPAVGGAVTFYLNYGTATQQQLGTPQGVAAGGTASVTNVVLLDSVAGATAPGAHVVTAIFTPADAIDFTGSSNTAAMQIALEDSALTYTGQYVFDTASDTTYSATVPLAFTVQDSNALSNTAAIYDANPGDLRNARYNVVVDGVQTPACSHLQPSLVNTDTRVGTIACNYTFSFPSSQIGSTPTIAVVADSSSYYEPSAGDTKFTITVSLPNVANSVNGGGFLVNTASTGTYAADAGAKTNFGFTVKYNKAGTNLQGGANIILQSHGRTYQIKSNSIAAMQVMQTAAGGYGSFLAKANLVDITDPANPVSIEGNDSLTITFHDNGTPGSNDTIGIALYNGSVLRFSSNWTGTATAEQSLEGGNLTAR